MQDPKGYFSDRFGLGWQGAASRALGVAKSTISRTTHGPVAKTLEVVAEFMATTPPDLWPDRWIELRGLERRKKTHEQDQ